MQVNHQIHKTQTMIETLQARLQDLANVAAKHKGISLAELANRTLEQIASIENWRTRILRLCIVRRRSQRRCKWSMDDQGLWSLGPDDYHRQTRHHGPISSVSLVIGMNIGIDHFLDLGLVSQGSQFWRYVHPKDTSGPEKESQQFKLRSGLMICGGKYGRKWPKTLNEKQCRKNQAGRCTTIDSCFFTFRSMAKNLTQLSRMQREIWNLCTSTAGRDLIHQRRKPKCFVCSQNWFDAHESQRWRINESGKRKHEEHNADRGVNAMCPYNLVHLPMLIAKAKHLGSNSGCGQGMGQIEKGATLANRGRQNSSCCSSRGLVSSPEFKIGR